MYDCQTDAAIEFGHSPSPTAPTRSALCGDLCCRPLANATPQDVLTIADLALSLGYRVNRQQPACLPILAVRLDDALRLNARFGDRFVVSGEMNAPTPIRVPG